MKQDTLERKAKTKNGIKQIVTFPMNSSYSS